MKIDPIDLSIYWNRLVTIAEEGASAIARTAFSRIVSEARDYSCVICDADGDLIAQPLQSLPEFVGSLQQVVRHLLDVFPPKDLQPGDTLMTNDPWLNTSQMNDFSLVSPIWRHDRIVAYAATVAHSPDVGGRLLSADAREVFEEGVCYPPCKLWVQGMPNQQIFDIIRANVRVPDIVVGDLEAQRAAHFVMKGLVNEFLTEERLGDLTGIAAEVKTRAERAVRRAIEELPDGNYESAVQLDGVGPECVIRCKIEVIGDRMTIDFEGTTPVNPGSMNCALNYVAAESIYTAIIVCRPETHVNAGSLKPFSVRAPDGCFVNAKRPTAVGARTLVVQYVTSAILSALAAAAPERVLAEPAAPVWPIVASGNDRHGRPFLESVLLNGGLGAHEGGDGLILGFPAPVISTKVEIFETETPMLVERSEYVTDSGGAGRRRGGLGQSFDIRSLSDAPIFITLRTERLRSPARGAAGGSPGAVGEVRLNGRALQGKETFTFEKGDLLELRTPGGGGFGDPRERESDLLLADVLAGLVSEEAAQRDYPSDSGESKSPQDSCLT